jgi:chromate transporter
MRARSAGEVFLTFLKLGLTSFGGPIAHLGYFRDECVLRRRWIEEAEYADLVALCQSLPGPASSQVGFSLGLMRAGFPGGLAAWLGFTLPSAALLTGFAFGMGALHGPAAAGMLHGLELVALAVVAQAVWGMARTLCPDRERAAIACVAALMMLMRPTALDQIIAIVIGGAAGAWLCRTAPSGSAPPLALPVSRRQGVLAVSVYLILLAGLPLLRSVSASQGLALLDACYRSGALVFGGGHVVLPLLRTAFVAPGWVTDRGFLAGYGAAQAVPGPLFTFAAYLGAVGHAAPNGLAGAAIGLVGIFLPGLLILVGVLPFWDAQRRRTPIRAARRGINAAVVGLLGAALYHPLWTTSVQSTGDAALALAALALLSVWRTPPVIVVLLSALAGSALQWA